MHAIPRTPLPATRKAPTWHGGACPRALPPRGDDGPGRNTVPPEGSQRPGGRPPRATGRPHPVSRIPYRASRITPAVSLPIRLNPAVQRRGLMTESPLRGLGAPGAGQPRLSPEGAIQSSPGRKPWGQVFYVIRSPEGAIQCRARAAFDGRECTPADTRPRARPRQERLRPAPGNAPLGPPAPSRPWTISSRPWTKRSRPWTTSSFAPRT